MQALFLIAHSDVPATPGLLAASLQVTPGAVTQLMVGLTDAGLVVYERHPEDARRRVLELSAASRERVAAFEQEVIGQLSPRFDGLDDDELRTLSTLLARTKGPL
jgi:DNA-binding MarR family transcriptional regulator